MKKLVFTFLFLLPLLSFAQRKEFVLVEKKQVLNNVFRDSKYETAVAIWIYAPLNQIEKFKFERTLDSCIPAILYKVFSLVYLLYKVTREYLLRAVASRLDNKNNNNNIISMKRI